MNSESSSGILDFSALVFEVNNAKTTAAYFVSHFGFKTIAVKSLETGYHPDWLATFSASHAVQCGNIVFIFNSPLEKICQQNSFSRPLWERTWTPDHVSEIVLKVDDTFKPPFRFPYMAYGKTKMTFISDTKELFGNNWEFVDNGTLSDGWLLPLPDTLLDRIDHVVGNQPLGEMEKVAERLQTDLGMHRFWSVDESVIHTEYSSLRSVVMASENDRVLLPINEPAKGKRISQIEEYLSYNGGAGVQHIALSTTDILSSVAALRVRGVNFLKVPSSYYVDLWKRLDESEIHLLEDREKIEEQNILVDFDENGYLLQIFTESMDYRPTVFFEIIQRNNHKGFGANNFKSLFEAIEVEQEKRGNL